MRLFIIIIAAALLANFVQAVGISPSDSVLIFEPGYEGTFKFGAHNIEGRTINVKFYVDGDLKEYFTLDREGDVLNDKEVKYFYATVKLPQNLSKPGDYTARVGVLESAEDEFGLGTQVGGVTAAESSFYIRVPYPGKYISLDLKVEDVVKGEPILFNLKVTSLGNQDINSVKARIEVFDPDGNLLGSVNTKDASLPASKTAELKAGWMPKEELKSGVYKAAAEVNYDGNIEKGSTDFKVGELLLRIEEVNITQIKEVVKFDIFVMSFWNDVINNVYANVKVNDIAGKQIGNFNTAPTNVNPWTDGKISQYWPIDKIPDGEYTAEVTVYYADKTDFKLAAFEIMRKKGFQLIYGVVGLLILIILILILYIRRQKKDENK